MNPLVVEIVGSILRWLLNIVAAFFVSRGIWTDEQADKYVLATTAALAVLLINLALALWSKYKTRLKLTTALATPFAQTERRLENQIANGVSAPASTPKTEVPEVKPPQ